MLYSVRDIAGRTTEGKLTIMLSQMPSSFRFLCLWKGMVWKTCHNSAVSISYSWKICSGQLCLETIRPPGVERHVILVLLCRTTMVSHWFTDKVSGSHAFAFGPTHARVLHSRKVASRLLLPCRHRTYLRSLLPHSRCLRQPVFVCCPYLIGE